MSEQHISERLECALQNLGQFKGQVLACRPISGGACQDNFYVELQDGADVRRYVLRSDALTSLPGSIGRREEFAVIQAAVDAGVPTPEPWGLHRDVVRNGAHAYLLEFLEGETIGARVTKHPKYASARSVLSKALAEALTKIHTLKPDNSADLGIERMDFELREPPTSSAIAFLKGMLNTLPYPRPATELGLLWLEENQPSLDRRTLVHGDFRTGNFMVDEHGLVGILDWEFAHWGDPIEDIGWLCVRDWRFGCITKPAGGLDTRSAFCAHYETASGHPVDRERLHWWEVCGNLRWAAAAAIQGLRYRSGGDFELLAIPRRAVEMEYEALRLIEVGPSYD